MPWYRLTHVETDTAIDVKTEELDENSVTMPWWHAGKYLLTNRDTLESYRFECLAARGEITRDGLVIKWGTDHIILSW